MWLMTCYRHDVRFENKTLANVWTAQTNSIVHIFQIPLCEIFASVRLGGKHEYTCPTPTDTSTIYTITVKAKATMTDNCWRSTCLTSVLYKLQWLKECSVCSVTIKQSFPTWQFTTALCDGRVVRLCVFRTRVELPSFTDAHSDNKRMWIWNVNWHRWKRTRRRTWDMCHALLLISHEL